MHRPPRQAVDDVADTASAALPDAAVNDEADLDATSILLPTSPTAATWARRLTPIRRTTGSIAAKARAEARATARPTRSTAPTPAMRSSAT